MTTIEPGTPVTVRTADGNTLPKRALFHPRRLRARRPVLRGSSGRDVGLRSGIGRLRSKRKGSHLPAETYERAEELIREDAERLRDAHPDLVEQLREYEGDWREFMEVLGRADESDKSAVAGLARRKAYHTSVVGRLR